MRQFLLDRLFSFDAACNSPFPAPSIKNKYPDATRGVVTDTSLQQKRKVLRAFPLNVAMKLGRTRGLNFQVSWRSSRWISSFELGFGGEVELVAGGEDVLMSLGKEWLMRSANLQWKGRGLLRIHGYCVSQVSVPERETGLPV